jgi:hypothetical protein
MRFGLSGCAFAFVSFQSVFVPTVYAAIRRSKPASCEYGRATAAKTKSWMFELSFWSKLSTQVIHSYPSYQLSLCGQDGIG